LGKEKEAKRLSRKRLCAIALAVIIVSTTFIYFSLRSPSDQTFQLKAVIIDQATLTDTNGFFFEATVSILQEANYTVDYYIGKGVTVEFYMNLPSHAYSLIIMRTHSRPTGICTGEPYKKTEHAAEQLNGELTQIFVGNESYFGITASFIRNSMRGRFRNTIILNMGCDALSETKIAEAFIEKGAKAYIGWKQSVLASHTDQATIHLLIHLIMERKTISQAVTETMTEMGPYPILDYYPLYVANLQETKV
jgi:hypothetical protein